MSADSDETKAEGKDEFKALACELYDEAQTVWGILAAARGIQDKAFGKFEQLEHDWLLRELLGLNQLVSIHAERMRALSDRALMLRDQDRRAPS